MENMEDTNRLIRQMVYAFITSVFLFVLLWFLSPAKENQYSDSLGTRDSLRLDSIERELFRRNGVKSVSFGKKEKVRYPSGYTRIVYPSEVTVCFNERQFRYVAAMTPTRNALGDGLRIDQTIVTKSGLTWHYDTHIPPSPSMGTCFDCELYAVFQNPAPREELVQGNIISYSYTVYFAQKGTRSEQFSGVITDFE